MHDHVKVHLKTSNLEVTKWLDFSFKDFGNMQSKEM